MDCQPSLDYQEEAQVAWSEIWRMWGILDGKILFGHKKLKHYKGGDTRRAYMVRDQNISRIFCRMASVKAFINPK
jgi:hypothetical protein